ncbi:MAG TPA: GrpB family protein [Bryobacteraceae bacterium]|nr:GrpB family protein [Bryobacteraceae bacterium]
MYEHGPAAFRDYDPVFAEVAALLIHAIEERNPRLHVDHIGSTSVPECRGKGVIDLAVTYRAGGLEEAKAALDTLGFQRQGGRDPWPEDRPMRVAGLAAFGAIFQVHAHVIPFEGREHGELVGLRDALRRDPRLRRAYEDEKQRILNNGITDSVDYSNAKHSLIASMLARIATP